MSAERTDILYHAASLLLIAQFTAPRDSRERALLASARTQVTAALALADSRLPSVRSCEHGLPIGCCRICASLRFRQRDVV